MNNTSKLVNARFSTNSLSMLFFIIALLFGSLLTISPTALVSSAAAIASSSSSSSSSPTSTSITATSSANNNTSSVVDKEQQKNSSASATKIPDSVKQFILNRIVNHSKSAIVVGFVNPNGTRVYSFGNISKANNVQVNENTVFRIASITKVFTTLLLADMVNQGIVRLDDPIEKYLPASVKVPEYKGQKITLENLATHTSGLPELPSNIWINNRVGDLNSNYTASQLYQALSNTTLTREIGSKVQYSSFGMGLLGYILSLKAGIPYEQLVTHRILDVLGMNDTKITLSAEETKTRFPQGHEGGKEIKTPELPEVLAGTGLLRSTATDMLKYVSANLGLISTKLDDAMQQTHLIRHAGMTANPMNYSEYVGLGWRIATNFGSEVFSHSGAINGWNAFIGFIPANHIGVVLLCSCDSKDVDMNNVGFVLLHLSGPETLTAKTETRFHTTPGLES